MNPPGRNLQQKLWIQDWTEPIWWNKESTTFFPLFTSHIHVDLDPRLSLLSLSFVCFEESLGWQIVVSCWLCSLSAFCCSRPFFFMFCFSIFNKCNINSAMTSQSSSVQDNQLFSAWWFLPGGHVHMFPRTVRWQGYTGGFVGQSKKRDTHVHGSPNSSAKPVWKLPTYSRTVSLKKKKNSRWQTIYTWSVVPCTNTWPLEVVVF